MNLWKESWQIVNSVDRWKALELEYGFNNTRILAHAVSWAFRPDNWRFVPWYEYLNDNLKPIVERHFTEMLRYQIKEMLDNKSNISDLIAYFKLPIIEPINKPFRKLSKRYRWRLRNSIRRTEKQKREFSMRKRRL